MTEPVYIAQTYQPEHIESKEAVQDWLCARLEEAKEKGATWPRATVSPDRKGLLLEAWITRPDDEGVPRWVVACNGVENGGTA